MISAEPGIGERNHMVHKIRKGEHGRIKEREKLRKAEAASEGIHEANARCLRNTGIQGIEESQWKKSKPTTEGEMLQMTVVDITGCRAKPIYL